MLVTKLKINLQKKFSSHFLTVSSRHRLHYVFEVDACTQFNWNVIDYHLLTLEQIAGINPSKSV